MKVIKTYGIPEVIVQLVHGVQTGTKAEMVTADDILLRCSISFLGPRVLEDDILSSYLFIIAIDNIMIVVIDDETDWIYPQTFPDFTRVGAEKHADAEFADDVALVTAAITMVNGQVQNLYSWIGCSTFSAG